MFEIDLSGGPFAPGATDEGDGSSEIEISVDTGPSAGDRVTVHGSDGPDTWLLDGQGLDLDGAVDEAPDVELRELNDSLTDGSGVLVLDALNLRLGAGNDMAHVGGGRDPDAPHQVSLAAGDGDDSVIARFGFITGGYGDDELVATRGFVIAYGGRGDDEMVASGRLVVGHFTAGNGRDLLLGGPDQDTLYGGDGDDVIHGRGGDDFLDGDQGDDDLSGGTDRDRLLGEDGDDLLRGGPGFDYLHGGRGRDRCDAEPHDLFVGGCDGPPLRRVW